MHNIQSRLNLFLWAFTLFRLVVIVYICWCNTFSNFELHIWRSRVIVGRGQWTSFDWGDDDSKKCSQIWLRKIDLSDWDYLKRWPRSGLGGAQIVKPIIARQAPYNITARQTSLRKPFRWPKLSATCVNNA